MAGNGFRFDDRRRVLKVDGHSAIPYEKLSGFEVYEDGKLIERGGTGIAKIVADYKGRKPRSLGRLIGTSVCRSLRVRIILADSAPVTVDLLTKPAPRKGLTYMRALQSSRELCAGITEAIDLIAEERIEKEAVRMVDYVKGRERTTAEILAEYYEKYRKGEITEDEFQRVKLQTLLNPKK